MEVASLPTDHNTLARLWSLTVLDRISVVVGQTLILESVLESGLATLIESFEFEAGAIVMRPSTHQLHLACHVGVLPPGVEAWLMDETGGAGTSGILPRYRSASLAP